MRVIGAMLFDAYRELNSKALFWVILSLSGLVVLTYASIGFNEDGMSMFFGLWQKENPLLAKGTVLSQILYRSLFTWFMVSIWLGWAMTILALIGTTSIFPDFMEGGAIEVVLSKPISRVTLFFVKFAASLLFMVLQVSIFCLGIFLCLGWRLGDWDFKIFAAIPILTVFFSYLYSVNVLVGVWKRSALAALLITMLLWFSLFSTAAATAIISDFRTRAVIESEKSEQAVVDLEARLVALQAAEDVSGVLQVEHRLRTERDDLEETRGAIATIDRWHRPVRVMVAILPKTGETTNLIDRLLKRDSDVNIMDIFGGNVESDGAGGLQTMNSSEDREVQRRMIEEINSRSLWYVLGTSLLFEAVVLAGACVLFVRRDY